MNKSIVRPTLVVVEDHQQLREELISFLLDEGFDAHGADGGAALNAILLGQRVDMVILDLNMPGEDGISMARRLRLAMPHIGIVMLTARTNGADRAQGYQSGADVYLTKPTRPAELSAVLNNLWARLSQPPTPAQWLLDIKNLTMTWGQARPIPLSHAEVQVLKLMGMSADYVEREALMAAIAGEYDKAPVTKARLELLISRLRAKLMPHTGTENVIKSVRGKGYQLCLHLQLKPVSA